MKYKGITIKRKPNFWNLLPWLSSYTAQAFFSKIYVSEELYNDLKSKKPKPRSIATLEHERKHIERQKKLGLINFGIRYVFFPKFRLDEELLAIKESMKYLKRRGLDFDIERATGFLSSWLYFWMTSYNEAKRELEKIWEEV